MINAKLTDANFGISQRGFFITFVLEAKDIQRTLVGPIFIDSLESIGILMDVAGVALWSLLHEIPIQVELKDGQPVKIANIYDEERYLTLTEEMVEPEKVEAAAQEGE